MCFCPRLNSNITSLFSTLHLGLFWNNACAFLPHLTVDMPCTVFACIFTMSLIGTHLVIWFPCGILISFQLLYYSTNYCYCYLQFNDNSGAMVSHTLSVLLYIHWGYLKAEHSFQVWNATLLQKLFICPFFKMLGRGWLFSKILTPSSSPMHLSECECMKRT